MGPGCDGADRRQRRGPESGRSARFQHEGEEYYVGPENQILGRITSESNEEDLPF